jgi:hypothetical protein
VESRYSDNFDHSFATACSWHSYAINIKYCNRSSKEPAISVYEREEIPMVARFLAGALEKTLVTWSAGAHGADSNHCWATPHTTDSSGSGPLFQGECGTGPRFRGGDRPTTDRRAVSRAGSEAVSGMARKKGLTGVSARPWKDATQTVSRTFLKRLVSDTGMAACNNCEAAAVGALAQLPESPADFAEALEAPLSTC